jgi:hypothetical protein
VMWVQEYLELKYGEAGALLYIQEIDCRWVTIIRQMQTNLIEYQTVSLLFLHFRD